MKNYQTPQTLQITPHRTIVKLRDYTLKKDVYLRRKSDTYAEKSEEKRAEFVADVARISEEKRVYVDEIGVDKNLIRERDRAPRGTKVEDVRRGRKFQRTNVIAGKIGERIIASLHHNVTHKTGRVIVSLNGFARHLSSISQKT